MKNPTLIVITVVVLAILGIGAYTISSSQKSALQPDLSTKTASTDLVENTTQNTSLANSASRYVEYSQTALSQAVDTRRVLYFYANWCPTCRPADASFRQNESQIPEDVTLIRVNYNDTDTDAQEKALAQKYGVTYQHTFIQIDDQGNEVTIWNGGEIDELLTN